VVGSCRQTKFTVASLGFLAPGASVAAFQRNYELSYLLDLIGFSLFGLNILKVVERVK
jgi:hypothetical protein